MKKQIWQRKRDGVESWREVELGANRKTLKFVRVYFPDKVVKVSDVQDFFGISRESAVDKLNRLHKTGFLRSKKIFKKKIKDGRVYTLSKKGRTKMPRKKPYVKIVERIVEVEKEPEEKGRGKIVIIK